MNLIVLQDAASCRQENIPRDVHKGYILCWDGECEDLHTSTNVQIPTK